MLINDSVVESNSELKLEYNVDLSKNKFNCDDELARGINDEPSTETNVCAEFNPICRKSHKLVIVLDNKLLCTHRMNHSDKPIANLTVDNKILNFLIDSGSDRTIIKSEILSRIDPNAKFVESTVSEEAVGKALF